jgi:[ribosomal protein S18]-alanine N-acetyltransferase
MSEWIIEPMQLDRDLDEVVALEAACFTNPTTRDMFKWEAEKSDVAHAYVMREAAPGDTRGALLAYCAVWLIFDELHINTLAVHPARRREGLASILLTHVLADATARGADKATLEVRRSNEAARRLYDRFGFTVGGIRPAYYRNPIEDALILWRTGLRSASGGPPAPPNGLA